MTEDVYNTGTQNERILNNYHMKNKHSTEHYNYNINKEIFLNYGTHLPFYRHYHHCKVLITYVLRSRNITLEYIGNIK